MKDDEIHVGDVLRVRQWDDMVREFGIYADGYIRIANKSTNFSPSMRRYCGQIFTVDQQYKSGIHGFSYKCKEKSGIQNFFVCSEMLEPVDSDKDFEVASDKDIRLLFS